MGRLSGKKILVTGGSKGIGKALVKGYIREGAEVAFTFNTDQLHAEKLIQEIAEQGKISYAIQADFKDIRTVHKTFDQSTDKLGGIDVLVNNAGTAIRTEFLCVNPEEFYSIFNINFAYPFFLTQAFCKYIIHHLPKQPSSSVINISSLSAERAVSRISHYQCSKAALSMLTRSVALEVADKGIRVNTIAPGLTSTPGNERQRDLQPEIWKDRVLRIPLGRAGEAADYVGAAVFLASDESRWMTGACITIDGGQSVI